MFMVNIPGSSSTDSWFNTEIWRWRSTIEVQNLYKLLVLNFFRIGINSFKKTQCRKGCSKNNIALSEFFKLGLPLEYLKHMERKLTILYSKSNYDFNFHWCKSRDYVKVGEGLEMCGFCLVVELPWGGCVTNRTTQSDIKHYLLFTSMYQPTELSML